MLHTPVGQSFVRVIAAQVVGCIASAARLLQARVWWPTAHCLQFVVCRG